jgi:hypothetical protein
MSGTCQERAIEADRQTLDRRLRFALAPFAPCGAPSWDSGDGALCAEGGPVSSDMAGQSGGRSVEPRSPRRRHKRTREPGPGYGAEPKRSFWAPALIIVRRRQPLPELRIPTCPSLYSRRPRARRVQRASAMFGPCLVTAMTLKRAGACRAIAMGDRPRIAGAWPPARFEAGGKETLRTLAPSLPPAPRRQRAVCPHDTQLTSQRQPSTRRRTALTQYVTHPGPQRTEAPMTYVKMDKWTNKKEKKSGPTCLVPPAEESMTARALTQRCFMRRSAATRVRARNRPDPKRVYGSHKLSSPLQWMADDTFLVHFIRFLSNVVLRKGGGNRTSRSTVYPRPTCMYKSSPTGFTNPTSCQHCIW